MVICKKKSVMTPIPATKQKFYKAGISVSIPIKKVRASHVAAANTDGPISFIAKAILCSTSVT